MADADVRSGSSRGARDALRASMLLDNHHGPDRRVEMECKLLDQAGIMVRVVAWDRRSDPVDTDSTTSQDSHAELVRINIPAPSGGGKRTFIAMLAFARAVWRRRRELIGDADVLLVHDVYLLALAWILSLTMRRPLIYDAHEDYAAMEGLRYPAWWLRLVTAAEDRLARRAEVVVVPGRTRCARWEDKGFRTPVVLRNLGLGRARSQGDQERRWDVAYCGTLADVRRLDVLIDAARMQSTLRVVIAGRGRGENDVREAATELDNVDYVGWHEDADELVAQSRSVYYGLDPDHPYAEKACPNTLYDALRLRRPLLYFCGGEVADIASRFRVGIRCEPTPAALLAAVASLAEPSDAWQFDEAWSELTGEDATRAYVEAIMSAAHRPAHRSR